MQRETFSEINTYERLTISTYAFLMHLKLTSRKDLPTHIQELG